MKVEKCMCGCMPVIELSPVSPVYRKYDTIQRVSCPECGNEVKGEHGIKLWNALVRVIHRNHKQRDIMRDKVGN